MHFPLRLRAGLPFLFFALCLLWATTVLKSETASETAELLCLAITNLALSWLLSTSSAAASSNALSLQTASLPTAYGGDDLSERRTPVVEEEIENKRIMNAFSIDLEDYFHTEVASKTTAYSEWDNLPSRLENTVPRLLDMLDEQNTKATVFVLGWVAARHPELVRAIASRGHEIACHSYRHRAVFQMEPQEFYVDTLKAKHIIEDATGCLLTGFRAPCFSITKGTEWAFGILSELGFLYDSSVNPIHHGFYGNPRSTRVPHYVGEDGLLEIPIAASRLAGMNFPVGGGAYLRLLPYAYSMAGLRHINREEKRPACMYMHPWELDDEQPDLGLPFLSRVRQTWGTTGMEKRVRGVLGEFRFGPIGEVYAPWLVPKAIAPATVVPKIRTQVKAFS